MKFSTTALMASVLAASTASAQEVISVHGSGTTNPSKCYWQIMDQMQTQAKLPVKMTYRGVGSSTGQAEFIGNVTHSDNMFGSGDIPIGADDYANFESGSILHLPVVLGAISFFHSVPTGDEQLNLSPCLLAKIMNRKITDWTDAEIIDENPNLANILPSSSPITVAHRVKGSSSTASITQYLNQVCPDEWPAELVGKIIEWPADTIGCEGSGGMTDCIRGTGGTIGYIDAGHGHSQNLQEIELLNAANTYISSKEASERGGILAAAENADLPATLDGDFSQVNLLNQGGTNTWPIVAMSYIYVRKDITFIKDPAAQTLLKAFLKGVYADEYITQCEEEFGFSRVAGALRDEALAEIDALVTSPGAPEWTMETSTDPRNGQGDFVISVKRASYSEVEQANLVDMIDALTEQVNILEAENEILMAELGHTHDDDGNMVQSNTGALSQTLNSALTEDSQVKAALVLSSISFAFWMLAIIYLIFKRVSGTDSGSPQMAETAKSNPGLN
ncbi:MAG: hypothetical protein SGILL_003445 [Bacillariaceae sp.]